MDKTITLPASLRRFTGDFARLSGRRGAAAALLVLLGAALDGVSLVLLLPILSAVLGSGGDGRFAHAALALPAALGAHTPLQRLAVLLAVFVALVLLRGLVQTLRDIRISAVQMDFVNRRRADVMRALTRARWAAVAGLRHARLSHLMSADMQSVSGAAATLVQCAVALVTLSIQCGLALLLSPRLALAIFVLLGVSGLLLARLMRRARDHGRFVAGANLSLLNAAAQLMGGVKLAVSQDLAGNFLSEFEATLAQLSTGSTSYARARGVSQAVATAGISLVAAAAVLLGLGVFHVAPAVLFTLLFLLSRLVGPITQLNQGLSLLAATLPAYDKVCELEAELRAAAAPRVIAAATVPPGPIVFCGVTFAWPGRAEPVLAGADLVLAPGRFIGIAGASGVGKTSFADLLVGLFAPSGGAITIGGALLDDALLPAWRSQLSYVSQDPFLFHDSVRRNLAWAALEADATAIVQALALTGADAVVAAMPEGLDTIVGERGQLMSGGERQRLALARALLRRPRLLVLDEATNAIDIAGEAAILEKLKQLPWQPTIVMIAHRTESFAACDEVWRLEGGQFLPV